MSYNEHSFLFASLYRGAFITKYDDLSAWLHLKLFYSLYSCVFGLISDFWTVAAYTAYTPFTSIQGNSFISLVMTITCAESLMPPISVCISHCPVFVIYIADSWGISLVSLVFKHGDKK